MSQQFTNRPVINLINVTDQSPITSINHNFRKLQAELAALNTQIEPIAEAGKQAKDLLDTFVGTNAPISKKESFEFTREFTVEYAQKRISSSAEPPSDPEIGDLWMDISTEPPTFRRWNGTEWEKLSVTTFEELEGMIDSSQLPDRVITSIKLAIDAVQSENIADQAVKTAKIELGAVTEQLIADGAIREQKLADLAVTLEKLADGAVGTSKLMDEAITNAKIAANAVSSINIQNGAIGNEKLANLAVTAEKLANGSVVEDKIFDGAVGTAKLADLAVTSAKIAQAAINEAHIGEAAIGTAAIQDLAVTNAKIAAIHADKITAGIIAAERIAIGPLSQFADGYDPSTKETPEGAQDKANQAEQNAINYTDSTISAVKNGFEDNEFSKWQLRGELTRVTDRFTGTYAGQFISTKTNPASGGSLTDTPALEIKNTLAAQFSGKRIKISFWAKTPSSNGTSEFAVQYSTAHVGNSGWQRFTPTSSWKEYVFYYTLSPINQNISHWLGVWADTSGTGKAILIDNVTITLASMEEDLILWKYPNTTYIDGGNIYTNTITANQIASRTITAQNIASGTITANEIASRTIQAGNIVSGTITANEISANAVTADKIASNAVTAAKIASNAVTAVKLASDSVSARTIQAEAVGAQAIAANAILAKHIAAGEINANHLAANAVTANAIAVGAVLAEHIASNQITAEKLNVETLSAISADLGNVTAGILSSVIINSSVFNASFIPENPDNVGCTLLNGDYLYFQEEHELYPGDYGTFSSHMSYSIGGISGGASRVGIYADYFDVNRFGIHWRGSGSPFNRDFEIRVPEETSSDYARTLGGGLLKAEGGNIVLDAKEIILTAETLIKIESEAEITGGVHSLVHEALPLQNGWQNYGGGFVGAAYTKSADGFVHLRGLIRNGAVGTVCAVLPAGCRPYQSEVFGVGSAGGAGRITVASNGNITVNANPGDSFLSLSGVVFRAEN